MPKYALPPQHRIRSAAIGKKGELECALLMESELVVTTKLKQSRVDMATSPTTIASTFDLNAMPMMKPLPNAIDSITPRPGAWLVVGKGGRPLKDVLMYDEPMAKKRKKKRNRARKDSSSSDDSNVLADLAEEPSTSTCEQMLHRSAKQRQKAGAKKKELKYWTQYRQEKQLKVLARDMLIHVLANEGMLDQQPGEATTATSAPAPLPRRHDKGSSRGAMLRRQARFASAAARCYSVEESEWVTPHGEDDGKLSAARRSLTQVRATGKQSTSMPGAMPADAEGDPSLVGTRRKSKRNCTVA